MSASLRTRLTLSYMLVAVLCVLMLSAVANGLLEGQFRRYVQSTLEKRNRQLADLISHQHRPDGGWDEAAIAAIGINALEQGVIVRVVDPAGRTVWDAMEHNSGLCQQMIVHITENMTSRYPNWQGAYTENRYPLRAEFREVGFARIGYYGPFFLNDEQLAFLNVLNRLLLWVALAALGISLGAGLLMARSISVPLARVVSATQQLAAGGLGVRLPAKTRVREIDRLTEAVNGLSRSLGEQAALRRRLTADMAHELRTPLATLQSHLEALIDGVWTPSEERLKGLHEETLRINRLVAELEDLARYESDAVQLSRQAIDLTALMKGIVQNHEPQFHAQGVRLSFADGQDGPQGAVTASVDPDRISQAVINLLANALKFTPAGGAVEVRVEGSAAGARIHVSDSGVGIRPEDLPRIFERLYRTDASRSRTRGGAGIGLTIARAIVEAHGGSIHAASEPGKGSRFSILLPAGADAAGG